MGPRDEYHKFLYKVNTILLFHLAVLHLYQLNRSNMLNARKIQKFVMCSVAKTFCYEVQLPLSFLFRFIAKGVGW